MPGPFFDFFKRQTAARSVRLLQLFFWPAVVMSAAGAAGVRFNATPSVPVGFYRITSNSNARFAEVCPPEPWGRLSVERGYRQSVSPSDCPDGGKALLKPIIARVGDMVKLSFRGISVNGVLLPNTAPATRDTTGRILSPWPMGSSRVAPGTVWVVSSYNPKSFDSRYFGPIHVPDIRHYLEPLWTE